MDGFREELLEKYGKMLDTVRMQMTYAPSREGIVAPLIRSIQKSGGTTPEDAPLYKVCQWLETHPLSVYESNAKLRAAICKDTKVNAGTIQGIFIRRQLKLPPHLQYKRTYKKHEVEVKAVEAKAKEPVVEGKELVVPPNIKELTIRSTGFEMTLRF